MTDQEKRTKEMEDFKSWSKIRVVELDEYFKTHSSSDIKTRAEAGKYWHLRMEQVQLSEVIDKCDNYDLAMMRLCIECLEHSKNLSQEIYDWWKDYWGCYVMDVTGEAHCKVGTPYYPRYGKLAEGKEKEEYEEIIELGDKYWRLFPKDLKV